jgi:hypothetical protein
MAKVKIIKGTFGLREGFRIIPKTSADDPFEVTDAQAERLVRLGVAVLADAPNSKGGDPADLTKLKKLQLQAIALEKGIEFTDKTKAKELAALIAAQEATPPESSDVLPDNIPEGPPTAPPGDDDEDDDGETDDEEDDGDGEESDDEEV